MNYQEEKINSDFLLNLKDKKYLYHGRSGINSFSMTKKLEEQIVIMKNHDEYSEFCKDKQLNGSDFRKKYGRTNLDAAFHGFYLTENYDSALKLALNFAIRGNVSVFEVDMEKLIKLNHISYIFPNVEWADFISENRNKEDHLFNEYDWSYSLMADGRAEYDIISLSEARDFHERKQRIERVLMPQIKKYHKGSNWNYNGFANEEMIENGYLLQVCISSVEALQCIKLVQVDSWEYNKRKDKSVKLKSESKNDIIISKEGSL